MWRTKVHPDRNLTQGKSKRDSTEEFRVTLKVRKNFRWRRTLFPSPPPYPHPLLPTTPTPPPYPLTPLPPSPLLPPPLPPFPYPHPLPPTPSPSVHQPSLISLLILFFILFWNKLNQYKMKDEGLGIKLPKN